MGVKRNFLYSSILTVSNYLFPLLTFPYVSRVLGVSNLGICNFVDSVVYYFILLSTLGVVSVGIREIASVRDDKQRICKTFSSILVLNALITFSVLIIYISLIYLVPKFYEHEKLMWIGVLKIVSNFLLIEWLYQGVENFKFITNRTITIKIFYVIAVFVFVRDANDYDVYFFLTVFMVVVNALVNILYSKRIVDFQIKDLDLKRYLKPILILGLFVFLNSMYTTFNVTFLGFVRSEEEVGYYTTAAKLHGVVIALYSAFTNVMMPRMSLLLSENKKDEMNRMVNKSLNLLIAAAVPIVLVCVIFCPEIINILSGAGFEGAILPARIIMPLLLVIGFSQVFIIQIMTPLKAEKYISRNSIVGAVVGIALNFMLVPYFGCTGSAIVWLISELVIMITSYYCVRKLMAISFPSKQLFQNLLVYAPLSVALIIFEQSIAAPAIVKVLVAGIVIVIYAFLAQYYYLHDETLLSFVKQIKTRALLFSGR